MPKPTIVFVPGAWHTPEAYSSVIQVLESRSYNCIGVHLHSIGPSPTCEGFTEDVATIRASVEKLIDGEEKEVVVVLHSYSGLPGSQALQGLGLKERQGSGKKGGLIRIVYIMAYLVPEGFQQVAKGDHSKYPEFVKLDEKVIHAEQNPDSSSMKLISYTRTASYQSPPKTPNVSSTTTSPPPTPTTGPISFNLRAWGCTLV